MVLLQENNADIVVENMGKRVCFGTLLPCFLKNQSKKHNYLLKFVSICDNIFNNQ